jgi:hypothetical protein
MSSKTYPQQLQATQRPNMALCVPQVVAQESTRAGTCAQTSMPLLRKAHTGRSKESLHTGPGNPKYARGIQTRCHPAESNPSRLPAPRTAKTTQHKCGSVLSQGHTLPAASDPVCRISALAASQHVGQISWRPEPGRCLAHRTTPMSRNGAW